MTKGGLKVIAEVQVEDNCSLVEVSTGNIYYDGL